MPSLRKHGESETDELADMLGDWAGLGGGGIDLSGMDEPKTKNAESVPDYLAGVIDPEARNGILTSLRTHRLQPAT